MIEQAKINHQPMTMPFVILIYYSVMPGTEVTRK